MLPAAARLRRSADFAAVLRGSRTARSAMIVVHAEVTAAAENPADASPQVGFIVPRSVGSAVVRNQVRRRLRHLLRDRVGLLPRGSRLVVRVLPGAAGASSAALGAALDRCLARSALARSALA